MEKSEYGSGWKKKIKVVETFCPGSYYKPGLKVHLSSRFVIRTGTKGFAPRLLSGADLSSRFVVGTVTKGPRRTGTKAAVSSWQFEPGLKVTFVPVQIVTGTKSSFSTSAY